MKKYIKPALTVQEQIKLLIDRNLQINDPQRTLRHLNNISYYRLSAYMLPFKKYDEDGQILDVFENNTTWNHVINLYRFDRKLRLLLFDSIERIEISIRTQIIYQLSLKYGSHWHDKKDLFAIKSVKNKNGISMQIDTFKYLQEHINKQLMANYTELFIKHYKENYQQPKTPPSWMSIEVMFFSHLSHICADLNNRKDRVDIAKYFGLPEEVFCSWLHSINYIRNLCAHHCRLWNRDLNIVPKKLSHAKNLKWISNPETVQRRKIYFTLCILNYLLQTVNPNNKLKSKLKILLTEFPSVDIGQMGFPDNWETENIWK